MRTIAQGLSNHSCTPACGQPQVQQASRSRHAESSSIGNLTRPGLAPGFHASLVMREHPLRAAAEWLALAAVVFAVYAFIPVVA